LSLFRAAGRPGPLVGAKEAREHRHALKTMAVEAQRKQRTRSGRSRQESDRREATIED